MEGTIDTHRGYQDGHRAQGGGRWGVLDTACCSPPTPAPEQRPPHTHLAPSVLVPVSFLLLFLSFFFLMHLRLLTSLYPGLWLYFIFKYLFTYVAAPVLVAARGVFSGGVRSLSGSMRDLVL